MSEAIDQNELKRRADIIEQQAGGIHAPFEAFYLASIASSAQSCCSAFDRYRMRAVDSKFAQTEIVAFAHEAIVHAGILSKHFFPSLGDKKFLSRLRTH